MLVPILGLQLISRHVADNVSHPRRPVNSINTGTITPGKIPMFG